MSEVLRIHLPRERKERFVEEWRFLEYGRNIFVVGQSGSGKTTFLMNLVAMWLEANRTVIYFSDQKFEILGFCTLPQFRDKVTIHTPYEITIENMKDVPLDIQLHTPEEPYRSEEIWNKLKRRKLNIILDTGLDQEDQARCVQVVLKLLVNLTTKHAKNILIVIDEGQWLYPHTLSTLYEGQLRDTTHVMMHLGKLRSYKATLVVSSQSTQGLHKNAFRNVSLFVVFKCKEDTARFLQEHYMKRLYTDISHIIPFYPDPMSEHRACALLYDTTREYFELEWEAWAPVFEPKPIDITVKPTLTVANPKARSDIVIYKAMQLLRSFGITTKKFVDLLREEGVEDITTEYMYSIATRGKTMLARQAKLAEQSEIEEEEERAPEIQEE
jgi:ABC-type oligopeptide transport system ATPase subunit